jgi:uncharacterized LabA/DUF88 family protein
MAQMLLPNERVAYVGYFTALIDPNTRLSPKADRQRAYLRALQSVPEIVVIEGSFRWVHHNGVPNEDGSGRRSIFWHWEEKGSDVNIAMHMIRDACQRRYSKMMLISNDSDLVGPVTMVVKELNIPVIQCSPDINTNKAFMKATDQRIILQTKRLGACRFPEVVVLPDGGTIRRPGACA